MITGVRKFESNSTEILDILMIEGKKIRTIITAIFHLNCVERRRKTKILVKIMQK